MRAAAEGCGLPAVRRTSSPRRDGMRMAGLAGAALLTTTLLSTTSANAQSTWTGAVSNIYGAAVNWTPGVTPNNSNRSAIFTDGGANTNITANIAVTVRNWSFSGATSYSITGADITFAGSLSNTSSVAQSIANNLGGVGVTVLQNGTGVLTLSGINTYTGDTTINAGVLTAGRSTSVGTGNLVLDGGTFRSGANNLSFSNNVVVGSAGGVIDNDNRRLTLTGTISDGAGIPGVLTFAGGPVNGLTIVTGTNTYAGGTVVANTTVQMGNAGALGAGMITLSGGEIRAGSSGPLTLANAFAVDDSIGGGAIDSNGRVLTLTGNIADGNGAGAVEFFNSNVNGTGRTILLGTNTYTGGTTICSCALVQLGDATHTASLTGSITILGELDILRADTSQITTIDNFGRLVFANNSTAGTSSIQNLGSVQFNNTSTAGRSSIDNGFILAFSNHSTAGDSTINNSGGIVTFQDNSTAGNASITNNATASPSVVVFSGAATAGNAQIVNSGTDGFTSALLVFVGNSSAGNAIIANNAFGGTEFGTNFGTDAPTAGNATITNNADGLTIFNAFSTAGDATITTLSGGVTTFFDNSTGGNARFIADGTGVVDFSGSVGPNGDGRITAGSIEGSGTYYIGAGNTLVVGGNNRSTEVSGLIADTNPCGCGMPGPGILEKVGTGTLTLSGANTYSGGTVVTAGVLEAAHVTAGVIDALGTGDIRMNGGTLRATVTGTLMNSVFFNDGTASTLSATAGQTLTVAGVTIGFGNNSTARFGSATDTGTILIDAPVLIGTDPAVEINGGTLVAGPGSNFAALTGRAVSTTVAAGATLDFADQLGAVDQGIRNLQGAGTVITGTSAATALQIAGGDFSGAIQGAGSLHVQALNGFPGGTLILSGTNTYTGGTVIDAAHMLQLGNGGASGSILGNVTNNGTLAFNRSDTYSFGGVISGSGAVQQNGPGNTVLTATSTYTGATTVNAGTLSVNGSIAASSGLTVNAGGTVGGNGTLPTTVINGGILAPGNSIGLVTVAGNLSFIGAGAYVVEVSPTAADRTNVTGTASLAGTLRVLPQGGVFIIGTRYVLLNATGGVSGTFGTTDFTSGFGALVRPIVNYDANNVFLDLVRNTVISVLPAGATVNQRNVAAGLDAGFAGGTIPAPFQGLFALSAAAIPGALNQLSGEIATGAATAGFQDMGQFLQLMLDPFLENRVTGGGSLPGGPALAFAPQQGDAVMPEALSAYGRMVTKAPAALAFDRRWTAWGAAFGATGSFDGNGTVGSHNLTARSGGFAGGIDYRLSSSTVLGFAAAGSSLSYGLESGLGSGHGDVFKAGLYASTRFDNAYVSASAAFGAYDLNTTRNVLLPGIGDRLTADFSAHNFAGRIETGYRFAWMGSSGITPYAAFEAQSFYTPGYGEADALGLSGFALTYGAKTTTEAHSEFGARFDSRFAMADGAILLLRGRLGWSHEFSGDPAMNAVFQTLPAAAFTVYGAGQGRDALLVSAGPEIRFANGWSLRAKFDGSFSGDAQVYAGTGALRYTW